MKSLSVRFKITFWFAAAMILISGITLVVVFGISNAVMQKNIQDNLIEIVENNVDEVEFFESLTAAGAENNNNDVFMDYKDGVLEVDDDFLDIVNHIYTSLCTSEGELLYGENPIALETSDYALSDREVQKVNVNGVGYYVFDCALTGTGLSGLWLRGIVPDTQGTSQLSDMVRLTAFLIPLLAVLAIVGGYIFAGSMLHPVEKISSSARQIGQGSDLKKRIDIGPGSDELHELADTFNSMIERLDTAFESEKQFTSDASHELRTPMSVILAECEYTLEKERKSEEYEESLKVIERQGKKMSGLIDDMLNFARLESGTGVYESERIDLSLLVRSVCDDMAEIREKGIELSLSSTDGIEVLGNKALLTRLLSNLIGNAYKYGKEDGHINVSLGLLDSGDVSLAVSDDGIGIAEKDLDKIFNRFYRADESHSGKGSGLGLAMVKEIARFHGGSVSVSSKPNEGSTFTVVLPKA